MTTELARTDSRQSLLAKMSQQYSLDPKVFLDTIQKTVFSGAKNQEQVIALLMVADKYGLDVMTKEIFAFPDKSGGVVPVVGVDGWSRIAQQHPQFDGIEFRYAEELVVPDGGKRCPAWIECVVYRKDRSHPVVVREYLDETYRKTGPWQSHTKRMLRHKATIQGYRMAFGFHGIYEPDEAERMVEIGTSSAPDTAPANVSERVLGRIAPQAAPLVDADSGEVIDVMPMEEATGDAGTGHNGDAMSEDGWEGAEAVTAPESPDSAEMPEDANELDLALQAEPTPLRKPRATQAQLKTIAAVVRQSGIYEAEYVALLDSYGAGTAEELTKENAEYVLAALRERQS